MTESTIARQTYMVTAKNDCTITTIKNGKTYILLTLYAGQQGTFMAISDSIECSDDEAVILPFA